MEDREKETIIRVEQQLKDSVENQQLILRDLKEIFQRIERESKVLTTLSGDVKGHVESSSIRWSELDKKLETINKGLESVKQQSSENERAIAKEITERTKSVNDEREERVRLHETVMGSVRMAKIMGGLLGGISAIITVIIGLITIISHIKGSG